MMTLRNLAIATAGAAYVAALSTFVYYGTGKPNPSLAQAVCVDKTVEKMTEAERNSCFGGMVSP